jgi:hypothetical protein
MLLLILVSCGKPKSKDKKQNQVFDEDGIFYGRIVSLNQSKAKGQITITKAGDSVEVAIKLGGLTDGTSAQYLYENNRCPIADLNSNGDIDINEVATQSGKRMVEFDVGTHESSYHLLLADLGRKIMDFEVRTLVVFQGVEPVGCAELESVFAEPPEEDDRSTTTYRPPRPRPEPEIKPPPPPGPEPSSWWSRLSARLRRWWCRMRGRCS